MRILKISKKEIFNSWVVEICVRSKILFLIGNIRTTMKLRTGNEEMEADVKKKKKSIFIFKFRKNKKIKKIRLIE